MRLSKFEMPFGKHKGEAIEDVPAGYLLWLYDEGVTTPEIRKYVDMHRKTLEGERKSEWDTRSNINNAIGFFRKEQEK